MYSLQELVGNEKSFVGDVGLKKNTTRKEACMHYFLHMGSV